MLVGAYPFRCLNCGSRFWMSIWLFSKLATAKCPKCLGTELLIWPEKYFRPTFWRRVMYTLGAQRYRCNACRCNFISFRRRLVNQTASTPPSKGVNASVTAE
jgi:DNA-directed RNA polymerase subunit RPC12/RpoP